MLHAVTKVVVLWHMTRAVRRTYLMLHIEGLKMLYHEQDCVALVKMRG
jgi:hypothetical protein